MSDSDKVFHLSVLTPEGSLLDREAVYVSLPASEGSLGVLYNHAPLVSPIEAGVMKVRGADGRTLYYAVGDGVLEIRHNQVTVLADFLNEAGAVDIERAKQAVQRAKQRMIEHKPDTDMVRAEAALRRGMARMHVAEMAH